MILYHGSSVPVPEPRLITNQRELDFGRGFYTTSDLEQASKWAKRTAKRLKQTEGYVSVYEIDETQFSRFAVLRFAKSERDWLKFVAANRRGESVGTEWDVIAGPVANDQTMPVLALYLDGMYDEDETIKRLLPQKLKDQYTFKTEKAIHLLSFIEVIRV